MAIGSQSHASGIGIGIGIGNSAGAGIGQGIGLGGPAMVRNAPAARLYEDAIVREGAAVLSGGALATFSGEKTGRSPRDKRIVAGPDTSGDVWWGPVNVPAGRAAFLACKGRALDFLGSRPSVYVVDGFAGWDAEHRLRVRVVCARAYHALFMRNLLIRPSDDELELFDEPDLVIYNAGGETADARLEGVGSSTSVMLDLDLGEMVILGTNYAGEMKKGAFTMMNHRMPRRGVLSMHCSANEGPRGDVSLFFGLSGTGKTTLSSDPRRRLIGDDEHCWSERGVFNIEGGCYAKCAGLRAAREPRIFDAIRFGAVLENVAFDPETRAADFDDLSITENTRACYPIDHVDGSDAPRVGGHPRNLILLTCDAFGVLPPVSRLSPSQAMYHYLSGYTAKVAGTEVGVREPQATFSACFGAAFLVFHPMRYAALLAEKIRRHAADAWLVNTGWTGGPHGVGSRIDLALTRAIIDAVHDGTLAEIATVEHPIFGVRVPVECPGVPTRLLDPRGTWSNPDDYDRAARELAGRFHENFRQYADAADEEVRRAGPRG